MEMMSDFVINENDVLTKYTGSDDVIVIPDGVREISWGTFNGKKETMKEVVIPESVEEIGNGVFSYCPNLEKVMILRLQCTW